MENQPSDEDRQELEEALAKLRTKMDVLEERAQLNEIKFNHEDYKEVCLSLNNNHMRLTFVLAC